MFRFDFQKNNAQHELTLEELSPIIEVCVYCYYFGLDLIIKVNIFLLNKKVSFSTPEKLVCPTVHAIHTRQAREQELTSHGTFDLSIRGEIVGTVYNNQLKLLFNFVAVVNRIFAIRTDSQLRNRAWNNVCLFSIQYYIHHSGSYK